MKTQKYILSLLGLFIIMSFSTNEKEKKLLEKVWVYENYIDGVLIYIAKNTFQKNKSGIEFKENGVLKVKQNAGWCGTEPISYEIVEGKWNYVNDSIVNLEYKYWGGNSREKRQIVQLTENKLYIKVLERN